MSRALVLGFALLWVGCGDDDAPVDGGGDAPVDGGLDGGLDGGGDAEPDAERDAATDASADAGRDAEAPTRPFVDTYAGGMIVGREPDLPGAHPVFLFVGDRGAPHDSALALAWIDAMARAGFVSAALQYMDAGAADCTALRAKAGVVFMGGLDQICGRARSDCTRGIVTAGHGQGGWIALLAHDVDLDVDAAFATHVGTDPESGPSVQTCIATERTQPFSRIRIVNGESDDAWGPGMRAQLNQITRSDCAAGITDCLAGDGSGWYLAPDAEVGDGTADRCFFTRSDGVMPCASPLDPAWVSTSARWGLAASVEWLASFRR